MQVEVISTDELDDRSYLAHDGRSAIVVDPQRDLDRVEEVLADRGLVCVMVVETHIHNDYVTGGFELTLVGGGRAPAKESARPEASVMPKGVGWNKDRADLIDPDRQIVTTTADIRIHYDHLVVCPGIQLDWNTIPGMRAAMDTPAVSSNDTYATAPKTWDLIRTMTSGAAVFTMPAGGIKCAGAPQRIAYRAADYRRQQGVLDKIRAVLLLPIPACSGSRSSPTNWKRSSPGTASRSTRVARSPPSTPTPRPRSSPTTPRKPPNRPATT